MTLWVHATGAYRSDVASKWRPADYNVRNLVKALKGESFKGYSNVAFAGKNYTFTAQDTAPAYQLWSNWAAARLHELKLGKVTVVPVPASDQVTYGQATCPVKMANALAALAPKQVAVGNFLRHRTKQSQAHKEGGSRNSETIAAALVCNVTDKSLPVVLVDDVKTTGSHLLAAARTLREHGVTVEHALVAGRAVWEAVENPYLVKPEDLEENPFADLTGGDD
jgi:hypothetical protein